MKTSSIAILSAAAAALLAAPAPAQCESSASSTQASYLDHRQETDIVTTAVQAGSFKTLATALETAGLVEALQGEGPFTVFAPTDDAFAKLPKGTVEVLLKPENRAMLVEILTYHVVPGDVGSKKVVKMSSANSLNGQRLTIAVDEGSVRVAGAKVVKTDIECSNGVIHVIDTVMMPSTDDIIDTAVAAGSFKTLAAAIKAAGLIEALQSDGPFTVFAPTDAAFAKLPDGTVESLLMPENRDKLVAILKFHVISGRAYSDQVVKSEGGTTLQGGRLQYSVKNGKVYVNDAQVIKADIDTSNGVIHVIDSVLIPQ